MDNEKMNNEEVTEEINGAEVQETAEVVEETECVTEEVNANKQQQQEGNPEGIELDLGANEAVGKKKMPLAGLIAIIAGGIVVLAAVVSYMLLYFGVINPWEKDYVDIDGVTLEELADQSGYSLSEYKKLNGLSVFMPKSTFSNAVNNSAKLKAILAQTGKTLDEFKEHYGWGDDVTEDTTVGEAMGKTKLSVIMGGEDYIEIFKEMYELPDSVTGETLYGEVRNQIDQKTLEMKKEQEKKEKEAASETAEESEPAESTEAAAESTEAATEAAE